MSEKIVYPSEENSSIEDLKTRMMGAKALDHPDSVAKITSELAYRVLYGGVFQQLGSAPEDIERTESILETIESGVNWMQKRLRRF